MSILNRINWTTVWHYICIFFTVLRVVLKWTVKTLVTICAIIAECFVYFVGSFIIGFFIGLAMKD